jgi:hypothetical protein
MLIIGRKIVDEDRGGKGNKKGLIGTAWIN